MNNTKKQALLQAARDMGMSLAKLRLLPLSEMRKRVESRRKEIAAQLPRPERKLEDE